MEFELGLKARYVDAIGVRPDQWSGGYVLLKAFEGREEVRATVCLRVETRAGAIALVHDLERAIDRAWPAEAQASTMTVQEEEEALATEAAMDGSGMGDS